MTDINFNKVTRVMPGSALVYERWTSDDAAYQIRRFNHCADGYGWPTKVKPCKPYYALYHWHKRISEHDTLEEAIRAAAADQETNP